MKFIKKADLIILSVIMILCTGGWLAYQHFFGNQAAKAEIYYKSQLVETVDLTAGVDKRFSIPQNKNVIFHVYSDGSIRFEESDCPDKICIRSGKLRTVGESAACLPNEIILKIVPKNGRSSGDVDMIAG